MSRRSDASRPKSAVGATMEQGAEEALDSLRRQFTSLIHHELKTPMASILGAACLLESELSTSLDPTSRRLVDIVIRNTRRLERLLENLLELQRITAGEISFELGPVKLRPLLEEIEKLGASDRRLLFHFGRCHGAVVYADREKLRRVLVELVESVHKSSWVTADVGLRLEQKDGAVLIHLQEEKHTSPLSEDGLTGDTSDPPQVGPDSGIGLTLAKELVAGMGGEVHLPGSQDESGVSSPRTHITLRLLSAQAIADTMASGTET